ncbi:MAG: DUF3300 domain-containing protein [Candidatus Acidiferrales bacterium]
MPVPANAQDQTPQDAQQQDAQNQPPDQQQATSQTQQQPYTTQTPTQLQQLVAPIALYPDSLIAQILAASTFPDQVVEADRWVQSNPGLKDQALADAVNNQPWDPSIKALCAFPSVLGNMDKNLSWTSSLGDAYYNQQQDVMDAIQAMRLKAQQSGTLKSTDQQTVTSQGNNTIVIQPANPQVVYVPAYNPWVVYGYPVAPWPGWYPYPGIWYGGPFLSFGIGFGIGFWGGYGWGWGHWGFDWHNHYAVYNHGRYYSTSRTFYNRNAYYHNGGYNGRYGAASTRSAFDNHGAYNAHYNGNGAHNAYGANNRPFNGDTHAARGYGNPAGQSGTHSSAYSGYDHGGQVRSYSSRGSSSMSHAGGFSGGGGGHPSGGGGGHGGGGGGHH